MDKKTQSHIGKWIIYVFLGVTSLLMLLTALGLSQWSVAKEMLQVWAATYSILVGAVMGHYFKNANTGKAEAETG
jgi:predicted ferric reductase